MSYVRAGVCLFKYHLLFSLSFFFSCLLFPYDAKGGGLPLGGCHGQSLCVCVEIDRRQEHR